MANLPPLSSHALLLLVLQLAALLTVSRVLAEGARRIGQPAVVGELAAGILLGPSLLGWISPWTFAHLFPPDVAQMHLVEGFSWFGMVMLMLLTGFHTDVRLLRHLGGAAVSSSVLGMLVPFAAGFLFGEYAPDRVVLGSRHVFAAFIATAMSITAMPVLAKILIDLDLSRRNIGVVILSAGVLDDTTGWLVLSVIAGVARTSKLDLVHLGYTLALTGAFIVAARWLAFPAARWMTRQIDDRAHARDSELSFVVIFTLLFAAATEWIGIHAVFGAFVAGCVLRQAPRLRSTTVERLESVTMSVFAPIFFGLVGIKVDLRHLGSPWLLLAVIGIATGSKLVGCTLGGLLGRMKFLEALAVGAGMNARGAMELVVALIGLTLGILGPEMYSIIVVVAVTTSFMAPLSLRAIMRHVPLSPDEAARIAGGGAGLFNESLQKVLVPTAGGPNAIAAARIGAGLVRGESVPVTALYVDRVRRGLLERLTQRFSPDLAGRNLQAHLDEMRRTVELAHGRLDVRRQEDSDVTQAVRRELVRGADLVLVGASPRALRGELLGALLDEMTTHLVVVRAAPTSAPWRRILVASDGSYYSRAAVELAVLYAEGRDAEITIVHVMEPSGIADEERSTLDESLRRMLATTLLASLSPVLTRTKVRVEVLVREDDQPERPVMRELEEGGHDLFLVGAEAHALRHRVAAGFDVERLMESAACAAAVVFPKMG